MNQDLKDERISAFLDGELSAAERKEVEALLHASAPHRQLVSELKLLRQDLQSLPRFSLGEDFAARVLAQTKKAGEQHSAAAGHVTVVHNEKPVPVVPRHKMNWLVVGGGCAATAACVLALVTFFPDIQPGVKPAVGNLPTETNPAAASDFSRLLASASQQGEAVVVRVLLTKDQIRGKALDQALASQGIVLAEADVENPAAFEAGKHYQDLAKAAPAATQTGAGDVLFVDADPAQVEKALLALGGSKSNTSFSPEALVASTATGLKSAPTAEGEAGSANPGTSPKTPTTGYAQHLSPRGFTLPATGSSPALPAPGTVGTSVKKPARVLIVVEVAD